MVQITVTSELAQAIVTAGHGVTLVDPNGRTVGKVSTDVADVGPIGMSAEHIAEIERRMAEDDGTRHVLSDVIARLRVIAPE
jgi:hypothetical protein